MAKWTTLSNAIREVIYSNGSREITGQVLQNALLNIISNLGNFASFAGVATPSTNPGTPDGPVYYFATQAGTYANFGALVLDGSCYVLYWNGTAWSSAEMGLPSMGDVTSAMNSLITAEVSARQQADTSLQSAIAAEATRAAGKEQELEHGVATLNEELTGELLAYQFDGFTVGSSWPSKKVAFQFIEGHTYAIKIRQTGADTTYLSLRDDFNVKHAEETPHSNIQERTWTVTVPANSACTWLYCTVESVTEADTIAVSVVDTANKGVVDSVNTLANAVASNTSDIADTVRYLDKPAPSSSTDIEDIGDMPNKVVYTNATRARVYDNAAISGADFRLVFEFDNTSGLRYGVVITETKGDLAYPNVYDTGWQTQNADIQMRPEWVGKYLQIRFSHSDDSAITLNEVNNAVSNFSYKSHVDTSATLTDRINSIVATETAARQQADTNIQSAITSEETRARAKEDEIASSSEAVTSAVFGATYKRASFVYPQASGAYVSKFIEYEFISGHRYIISSTHKTGSDTFYMSLRDSDGTKHEESEHRTDDFTWTVDAGANRARLYCTIESITASNNNIAVEIRDAQDTSMAEDVSKAKSDVAFVNDFLDCTPSSIIAYTSLSQMRTSTSGTGGSRRNYRPYEAIIGEDYEVYIRLTASAPAGLRYGISVHTVDYAYTTNENQVSDTGWKTSPTLLKTISSAEVGNFLMISLSFENNDPITAEEGISWLDVSFQSKFLGLTLRPYILDTVRKPGSGILDLNPVTKYEPLLKLLSYPYRNSSTTGNKPLVLLHFSDIHASANNLLRILEFANAHAGYIDDILHTGDSVNARYDQGLAWLDAIEGAEHILNTVGNHDTWDSNNTPAHRGVDCYNMLFKPYIANWGVTQPAGAEEYGKCYYYKDYTQSHVRLIVVDCMLATAEMEEQASWLTDVLSDALSNSLSVIIAIHSQPNNTEVIDCSFSSQHRVEAQENIGGWQLTNVVNTFVNNGGEFIAWIGGHVHRDRLCHLSEYFTYQLVILIDAARTQDHYMDKLREPGTKTQDLFNLVAIDTTSKVIKLVRVGADTDRFMRVSDMMCIRYTDSKILFD